MKAVNRKNPITPIQKARAWEWAAYMLDGRFHGGIGDVAAEHLQKVVVPALRRRADIIRRNARKT